jgi:hypothetical protein
MRPAYLPSHSIGISGRGGSLLHTHHLSQFGAAPREARAHRSDRYAQRFSSLLIGQIFHGDEQDDLSVRPRQLCHRAFEVAQLQRSRCVVHRSEVVVQFFNVKQRSLRTVDRRTSLTFWRCISVNNQLRRLLPDSIDAAWRWRGLACPGRDHPLPICLTDAAHMRNAEAPESAVREAPQNCSFGFPPGFSLQLKHVLKPVPSCRV